MIKEWLNLDPRPPLDQWFSRRAQTLSKGERKSQWETLDKEIRGLMRRMVLTSPDSLERQEAMKHWTPTDLNRVLKNCLSGPLPALPGPESPVFATACGLPPWLYPFFEKRVARSRWTQEQRRRFLENLQTRPPLHLRFNSDPAGMADALKEDGFRLEEVCDGGWLAQGEMSLYETRGWKTGKIEIQDAASQMAGLTAQVRPGQRVWDVCAGEGGKSLLLAGELRGKGGVWCTDIYERKIQHLKTRSKKAGLQNIRALVWDGEHFPDTPETRGKQFDVVVVDAPCSASGTWRRDPEASLRLFPREIPSLVELQGKLLRSAWSQLKPGGRLVYITCSWLVEENEEVFEPFCREVGGALESSSLLGSPDLNANTFYAGTVVKPRP